MKHFLTLVIFLVLLISCQEQSDKNIELSIVQEKVSENAKLRTNGKVPSDNPIMLEMLNFEHKDLNRIDLLYKEIIENYKNEDYYNNLKQYGFILLLEHGLIEDSDIERKMYYIQEQMNLPNNYPNFKNFYDLLLSLKDQIDKQNIFNIADEFYSKNDLALKNNIHWSDDELKKKKQTELNQQYKLFYRYINVSKSY